MELEVLAYLPHDFKAIPIVLDKNKAKDRPMVTINKQL